MAMQTRARRRQHRRIHRAAMQAQRALAGEAKAGLAEDVATIARALLGELRPVFEHCPDRTWSPASVRQAGLTPFVALVARQASNAIGQALARRVVEARRRSYLRAGHAVRLVAAEKGAK